MAHDETREICRLIIEHVSSPSLRHIRDKDAIEALARRVTDCVDFGVNGFPSERR